MTRQVLTHCKSAIFAGALLASTLGTIGCAESERRCIERVLREDRAASEAGRPDQIVAGMRGIETSSCPVDFRDAYVLHIQAWDQRARLIPTAEAINKPVEGFWDGVVKGAGAVAVGLAEVEASQAVSQTFAQVERVAARHGASLR